jgi:sulfonate transport system permease protein
MLRVVRPFVFPLVVLAALEWWTRTVGKDSDALAPPTKAAKAFAPRSPMARCCRPPHSRWAAPRPDWPWRAPSASCWAPCSGCRRRAAGMGFLSIEVLRPIPSVALIPLVMLAWGFGFRMEIAVITFASVWPMLILTQAAVRQVEPRLLEVAQALQLSPRARFTKIVLPAMVPRLFVALRLGVAIALVVAVTVEIAANPHGMGYALIIAQQSLDPALMLAWLFWIGVVGYAINVGSLWLQRTVARRMGEQP